MISHAVRPRRRHLPVLIALAILLSSSVAFAQETARRALTVEDYSLWRSISDQEISADGTWVSYGLRFSNTRSEEAEPVLHILNLETDQHLEVPDATGGTFSNDSRWIAYQIDPGGGDSEEEAEEDEPRRAELRSLTTGDVRTWLNIQSFTFSDNSTHLILQRRPTEAGGGGSGRAGSGGGGRGSAEVRPPTGPRGVDVIVHDLATGHDLLLGSVGDISFDKSGELLAFTVDAADKDGNGLSVLDLESGRMHVLDNDAKSYNRLAWSEDGTALAVLKGVEVEDMRERDNVLIAFP